MIAVLVKNGNMSISMSKSINRHKYLAIFYKLKGCGFCAATTRKRADENEEDEDVDEEDNSILDNGEVHGEIIEDDYDQEHVFLLNNNPNANLLHHVEIDSL